jgi:hypothetical protein
VPEEVGHASRQNPARDRMFGLRIFSVIEDMSVTNRRIIVWGTGSEQAVHTGNGQRRIPALRSRDTVQNLRQRYSELTALAARLVDECRRLRADNDDLRGSAEIWIRLYERQLERANALEAASQDAPKA